MRGVELTVVTLSPDGASEAGADGHRVVLGDSTKQAVLEHAGLERARLLVVAEDEHETTVQIARVVSGLRRYEVPLLVRPVGVLSTEAVAELADAGAARVLHDAEASRRALTRAVLVALDTDQEPSPGRTVVDTSRVVRVVPLPGSTACGHQLAGTAVLPGAAGCEQCLRDGRDWVHLRVCASCGHVGCCDSSPGRHARAHSTAQEHPVIVSAEPGEHWAYCFDDDLSVPLAAGG